jgi:hypothetical protein
MLYPMYIWAISKLYLRFIQRSCSTYCTVVSTALQCLLYQSLVPAIPRVPVVPARLQYLLYWLSFSTYSTSVSMAPLQYRVSYRTVPTVPYVLWYLLYLVLYSSYALPTGQLTQYCVLWGYTGALSAINAVARNCVYISLYSTSCTVYRCVLDTQVLLYSRVASRQYQGSFYSFRLILFL